MKIVYEKADPRGEPWPRDEIGFLEDGGEVIPRSRRRPYFPIALAKAEEYKEIPISPKGVEVKRREPSNSARAVALRELTAFLFAHPSWSAEAAMDAVSTARLNALYAAYKAVQNKPT